MFKWRLHYEDGSTFSDTDGAPHDSPPWGVVAVSQPAAYPQGEKALVGNGDVYLYREDLGYWHEVGDSGLVDHLSHYGHLITCIRPGRWMPRRDEFFALWERVRDEAR